MFLHTRNMTLWLYELGVPWLSAKKQDGRYDFLGL